MKSIRRKLSNKSLSLYTIQDIAGCRVILDGMPQVIELLNVYRSTSAKHLLSREDDYISNPKLDGYRSHHLIFKFCGLGEDAAFNRQKVEVQIRTKIQHAWATAVESVGLFRNENLKAGKGDADWLNFFRLASSELAFRESCALVPETPESHSERLAQIRSLADGLDAVKYLENINQAIKYAEERLAHSQYFIVVYNVTERTIRVEPVLESASGPAKLAEFESGRDALIEAVMVEADRIEDLKAAFPNYFLDVKLFTDELKRMVYPELAAELPPKENPPVLGQDLNVEWLKNWPEELQRTKRAKVDKLLEEDDRRREEAWNQWLRS